MYDESNLPQMLGRGELAAVVISQRHPDPPLGREPLCTWSQMVALRDRMGTAHAHLHRYLRPDGTVGLSGKADPKRLLLGGEVFVAQV